MKWIFRQFLFTLLLVTSSNLCLSASSYTILGLETAKSFKGKYHEKLFIRAASFSEQSQALKYKSSIQTKAIFPVAIMHKQGFYVVTIGPMNAASDARKSANNILTAPKKAKAQTASKNTPHKATLAAKTKLSLQSKHIASVKSAAKSKSDMAMKRKLVASAKPAPKAKPIVFAERAVKANPVTHPIVIADSQPTATAKPAIMASQAPAKPAFKPEIVKPSAPILMKDSGSLIDGTSSTKWIAAVGAGIASGFYKDSMTVNNGTGAPPPNNLDIYSTKHDNEALLMASAGRRWVRQSKWLPSYTLGLTYQHIFAMNVGGTITEYSDPAFLNYDYKWDITSDVLMATAKLNLIQYYKVSPFISGGVGGSYNRTSYQETALAGVTARTSPAYSSNPAMQFAYGVGAGLDYQVDEATLVSLEYRYLDLGNIHSGNGAGSWSTQSLNLGSYHLNTVLVSVGYLFGN